VSTGPSNNSPGALRLSAVLADLVLLMHFLLVLFAVLGAGLVLFQPLLAILHVPFVMWSSVVNLADWTCPLTPLEQGLRRRAGQQGFSGGWIQYYLEPLVRPLGMPRRLEWVAGISVLVWNGLLYSLLLFWYLERAASNSKSLVTHVAVELLCGDHCASRSLEMGTDILRLHFVK